MADEVIDNAMATFPRRGADFSGVRVPDPRDFIPHYRPAMKPSLKRVNGEISLMVMDENGHMRCVVLSEVEMNELALSVAQINQEIAGERL